MNDSNHSQNGGGGSSDAGLKLVRKAFLYANTIPGAVEIVLCIIVLVTSVRIKAHRSPQNLLILASAAIDLIRGIHSIFSPFLYDSPVSDTPLNLVACQTYQWVHAFQYAASCWIIAAIAYSRYDYVSRPVRPRLTLVRTVFILCIILVEAAIFASLPLMGWQRYYLRKVGGEGNYLCSGSDKSLGVGQRAYTPIYFGVNSGLSMVVVVICLARIVPIAVRSKRLQERALKVEKLSANFPPFQDAKQVDAKDVVCSGAFLYVILIVLSNIVLSAPFVISRTIRDFALVEINDYVIPVTKFIFNTNFVVNSVLYIFWMRTFRKSVSSWLCCKRKKENADITMATEEGVNLQKRK